MTITHEASSGVEVAVTAKGTTSTTVAYAGVAAGRLGVLSVTLKPDTAVFGAVAGWTPVLDVAGGAAEVLTSDAGPTRLGVWVRTLDGSETGNITITATGTPDCLVGGLSVYSTTGAGWAAPTYVSGTDATHAAAFSASAGAWAATLNTGDLLVIARSSDSDAIGAKSLPTLTQTGATFDTINYRNNRLNSSAADCCVATWDTAVLTGSANAPTFAHAMTGSSCGALAIVRIRESSGGGSTVTGTATADFAFSAPASGRRTALGTAALTATFAAPAVGRRTVRGSSTTTFGFSAPVAGRRTVLGRADLTTTFSAPVAGQRTVRGIASATFDFIATATASNFDPPGTPTLSASSSGPTLTAVGTAPTLATAYTAPVLTASS